MSQFKEEKMMPEGVIIRRIRYLNNLVEQDHRFIKKRVRSMLGLKKFRTAKQIICGVEMMHMLKKGQLQQGVKSVQSEIEFTHKLFRAAS
jgi:transposase-like protein